MNKLYSIIVPHRNIPNLLRRLLCSIPKRDDIEIIVVDDKSNQEFQPELHGLQNEFCNVQSAAVYVRLLSDQITE